MIEEDLDAASFARHPVWTWDETGERYRPIEHFDPLPQTGETLFIRARFVAASGESFRGYLVGCETFYAFGLFVDGGEFVINLNLKPEIVDDVAEIAGIIGAPNLMMFPLHYIVDIEFANSVQIEGDLEL